jgi:hypothetical protein
MFSFITVESYVKHEDDNYTSSTEDQPIQRHKIKQWVIIASYIVCHSTRACKKFSL